MCITPKHMLGSGPQLSQHRLSGQSLLSHMRIEDEEEEIEEEELVAVIHPSAFSRRRLGSDMEQDELEIQSAAPTSRVAKPRCSPRFDMGPFTPDHQADSYYLEPLMPAISKPAKEKSISLNKEEESGESRFRTAAAVRKAAPNLPSTSQRKELNRSTFTPIPAVESAPSSLRPPTEGSIGISQSGNKQPHGFFLHSFIPSSSGEPGCPSPFSTVVEVADSDSDIADLEEDEEDDDQMELTKDVVNRGRGKYFEDEEECEFGEAEVESVKLREDLKVSERDDKEDCSGRSSPCPSTISWASSCSASGSTSVKMTSFAERKLLKLGLRDGFSSTSSSQKTTPDGSEVAPCPPWQLRSDCTSGWMGKEPISVLGKTMAVSPSVVPSELLQLHMQLEEQRRAIEYQKKKMETLSARQRLKLGKAAFLNIVKKGGGKSDTLPLPLRHSESAELAGRSRVKIQSCKDDSCLDALKVQAKAGQTEGGQMKGDNRSQDSGAEPDLNECSHSIDLLNEAISSIQQQMMQLSFQQDLLMKRVVSPPEHVVSPPECVVPPPERVVPPPERVVSPPERVVPPPERVVSPPEHMVSPPERVESGQSTTPDTTQSSSSTSDSRSFAVHFVDISGSSSAPARRPPKLSSSQRRKASEQKQSRENSKMTPIKANTQSSQDTSDGDQKTGSISRKERNIQRNTTFRVRDDLNFSDKSQSEDAQVISSRSTSPSQALEQEDNVANSGKEASVGDENTRAKGQLIEVDLSELKNGSADGTAEGEQRNALGFFFKVKVRIVVLLVWVVPGKQLLSQWLSMIILCFCLPGWRKSRGRNGEASRCLPPQTAAQSWRDETPQTTTRSRCWAQTRRGQVHFQYTLLQIDYKDMLLSTFCSYVCRSRNLNSPYISCRRKAEEDRIRKEEEKARRELIKQEYLRRKQQALMEEQGLVKPRPRTKSRRSRPKSLHREESNSLSKGSTTRKNTSSTLSVYNFVSCSMFNLFNHMLSCHLVCACVFGLVHLCTSVVILWVCTCVLMQVILWRCPCCSKRRAQQQTAWEVNPSNLLCMMWYQPYTCHKKKFIPPLGCQLLTTF